jgi:hypothetical protein
MFASQLNSASRRCHARYAASGTATVYQGSNQLDLPILDVSLTGIRLQTTDTTKLKVGGICFITLRGHGKHDALVVNVHPRSIGFLFLTPEPEGVRSFIAGQRDALG